MAGLLDTASGLLSRRSLATVWLPVLVFVAAAGALVIGTIGWTETLAWWAGTESDVRILLIVLAAAATALAAEALAASRAMLVRALEGYWEGHPGGALVRRLLVTRHRELWSGLRAEGRFPDPAYPIAESRIMPTRIGNVLRAAEEHARRYRIDAVLAWPRLYAILPDPFTQAFAAAAARFELLVVVTWLSAAFTLLSGAGAGLGLAWHVVAICLVAGTISTTIAYRAAGYAAAGYAELIRSAFDVHRLLLLDAMGLERPDDFDSERALWEQVDQLWRRGSPATDHAHLLRYRPSPQDTPPAARQPIPAAENITGVPVTHGEPDGTRAIPDRPADALERPAMTDQPTLAPEQPAATSEQPAAAPARRRRTTRAARRAALPLGLAGTAGLLALLGALMRPAVPEAPSTTRDLPAYHVLVAADLVGAHPDLLGRYTLVTRPKGRLDVDELGPKVGDPAPGQVVTTLAVSDASGAGRGDRVTLLSPHGGPVVTVPALILDVVRDDPDHAVVAVTAVDLKNLLATGGGPFLIARDAA
ncbi:hypothetical protein [Microbispora sp. NPDC049125]|uniref:hypothetical protein n=1 Tax=Microbispora sp. NPDC049125 TaxID=3154929 RepID=UPI00346793D2